MYRESAGKTQAFTGKAINIGCADIRIPISSQNRGGLIVSHNKQNIRLGIFCFYGYRKKNKQR